MFRKILPVLALCAAPTLLALVPQKRASKKKVQTFAECIQGSTTAWDSQAYGTCIKQLQEAVNLCKGKQRALVLAAMPAAPAGWTAEPQKKQSESDAAAMAMFGMGMVSIPIEQVYSMESGSGRMNVQVMLQSPMVQMMGMMFSNPAMLDNKQELIEYEADKAILTTKDRGAELQILLGKKNLVTASVSGTDADFLLKAFDQATIDRLKAAMAN